VGQQQNYEQVVLDGSVVVPYTLLRTYAKHGLDEVDVVVLLAVLGYAEREHNRFPTFDQLAARMSVDVGEVARRLQKLVKQQWLVMESVTDGEGMQSDVYSTAAVYAKLAGQAKAPKPAVKPKEARGLYPLFEAEFARPLSPMEIETIDGWETQDRYPRELILHALKEAVFAGKLHFRYIDRILLDWQNNKIKTVDQAKAHSQQFRAERR
jgi:DNA replication protein